MYSIDKELWTAGAPDQQVTKQSHLFQSQCIPRRHPSKPGDVTTGHRVKDSDRESPANHRGQQLRPVTRRSPVHVQAPCAGTTRGDRPYKLCFIIVGKHVFQLHLLAGKYYCLHFTTAERCPLLVRLSIAVPALQWFPCV